MKIKTLIGITSCVLFAVKCGKDFPEEQKRPGCVQYCKTGEQEEFGDHCYFWSSNKQNWDESKSHCEIMNGTLAAVTSLPIHNFLVRKVDKGSDNQYTWFWIGGTDRETEGNWKWVDGSDWNFSHWATLRDKQPSGGPNQNCLQIYHGRYATNGWNDQYCYMALPFICSWKICQGTRYPYFSDYSLKNISP